MYVHLYTFVYIKHACDIFYDLYTIEVKVTFERNIQKDRIVYSVGQIKRIVIQIMI